MPNERTSYGLAGSRIDHGKLGFSPAALSRRVDHEPHVAVCRGRLAERVPQKMPSTVACRRPPQAVRPLRV